MARFSNFLALAAAVVAPSALAQPVVIFPSAATGLTHKAGTGVKASPDGSKVYATADDGSLVIANAADGSALEKKKPAAAVACETGVSFSPDGSEVMYAVWTAADGASSQINAYSTADNSPTWSFDVPGRLAGAPMYGKDGAKVYFTWNDSEGHFTALSIDGSTATQDFTQSLTDIDVGGAKGVNKTLITSELTWSGVDVAIDPSRVQEEEDALGEPTGNFDIVPGGNHRFGEGNTNDLVVWAHLSPDGAKTNFAYYYVYQAPILPTDPHEVIALDDSTWAVFRRPVLSSNGIRMLVAAQRGTSRGWTEPALLSQGADVKLNIKQQQRNGPNPTMSTPSFTPDDQYAFFASTTNALYMMRADEASVVDEMTDCETCGWEKADFQGAVIAGTQTSDDSEFVYAVTSNGFVHKLGAADGVADDGWTDVGVAVGAPISAEFDVVEGKMFFVTEAGALNAWTVGPAIEPPTTTTTTTTTTTATEPTTTTMTTTTTTTTTTETEDSPVESTTMAPTMAPASGEDTSTTTTTTTDTDVAGETSSAPTMAPAGTDPAMTTTTTSTTTDTEDDTTTTTTMAPVPDTTTTTTTTTITEAMNIEPTLAPTPAPTDEDPFADPGVRDSSAVKASAGLAALLGAIALMVL